MVATAHIKEPQQQQQQQQQLPDSRSVVLDQHDESPFLQADVVPLDFTAAPERQQQGQHQQVRSTSSKGSKRRTPSAFARMFCCSAPVAYDPADQHTGELNGAGALPMQQSLRSQHSWGKVYTAHSDKQHLQAYPSSEYHDARSNASDLTPQHSLERASPSPAGAFEQQQYRGIDQQASVPQELPHWVPPQPLLFAPPGLKFVPVPEVTGFAGVWELVKERTTPHPQPIDVMSGASLIVRKVHASVPGITIEEDAKLFKFIAQPSFMPRGLPAAHTETYDKSHATAPTWMPRRDLKLGTAHGHVYYTEDGQLIIRHETWSFMGRKPDFIVEDYCTLEEGGKVLVDRMCACHFKTGQRAEQMQVVRLVSRPGQA